MKKIVFSFILFSIVSLSFAGTPSLFGYKSNLGLHSKEFVSSGIYVNVGIGFPTLGGNSRGVMPNVEFGNHFLFFKKEKFGVGMKFGWVNLGLSTFTDTYYGNNFYYSSVDMVNFDFRFVKFGPLATFAFTEKIGLDVYIDAVPTMIIGVGTGTDIYGDETSYSDAYFGVLVAPGAKFRFRMFTAGLDISVGSLYGDSDIDDDDDNDTDLNTRAMFMPRIYAGFKF